MIPLRDNVPSRRYPLIVVTLVAVNIGVFFFQLSLPPDEVQLLVYRFGVVPERLAEVLNSPQTLPALGTSLFTSMFLHGSWLHLIGNLWYLWIFGDNVEDRMGHFRFLVFFLLCGLLASLLHIFIHPDSSLPAIGASGAIAGVLGAYLVSYPFARILTLVPIFIIWPIVELPALIVLGSWFLVQILQGMAAAGAGFTAGVAWWAHIGGFGAGMVLCGFFFRKSIRRYTWETNR